MTILFHPDTIRNRTLILVYKLFPLASHKLIGLISVLLRGRTSVEHQKIPIEQRKAAEYNIICFKDIAKMCVITRHELGSSVLKQMCQWLAWSLVHNFVLSFCNGQIVE